MIKYVYPRLPAAITAPFVRFGGVGLANCLFVFAKAVIYAERYHLQLINPTWANISRYPWLHWEKDKRTYVGIFKRTGISGLKRVGLILFGRTRSERDFVSADAPETILRIDIMDDFEAIKGYSALIRDRLAGMLTARTARVANTFDFERVIAVHIRLGDYRVGNMGTPLHWYKAIVENIRKQYPQYSFLLFSDGSDEELKELLALNCVRRQFFGNAMADIWAISRCKALIGSNSTFSAWGAYLTQIPIIVNKFHLGHILDDRTKEFVLGDSTDVPDAFFEYLK